MGREPGRLQRIAALALTLAMLWMMLPEYQRRLILMKTARALQRVSGRAAHVEGRAGMGSELAGRDGDAQRSYRAAFHLSRARDAFGRALESLRP